MRSTAVCACLRRVLSLLPSVIVALFLATAAIFLPSLALAQGAEGTADSVTQVEMRNVRFHIDERIELRIRYLRGTMRSKQPGTPVNFDDKRSFVLRITRAEVGLSDGDLTDLLNNYVFNYRGSPLKHLRVTTVGRQLKQTGIMHKGVDIPFEIIADVEALPDGHIRLRPTKTRIFGVDGDALMRALHLKLDKLLDLSKSRGARVEGNDILLDPDSLLPPPTMQGRVSAVRVEGNELVQQFGNDAMANGTAAEKLDPPDREAPNYMFYRHGTLRFGKLIMLDAEMQIIDLHPSDPFDFNLDHYKAQLVAGYSRSLPDGGLEVFMPDYSHLGSPRTPARDSGAP